MTNVFDTTATADDSVRSPKRTNRRIAKEPVGTVSGSGHHLHRKDAPVNSCAEVVRLPALRRSGDAGGPHAVGRGVNDAALDALMSFERRCGVGTRDYAARCLALAQRFGEPRRPWLRQVRQAVAIATVGVKRVYEHRPHLFAADNAATSPTCDDFRCAL